MQACVLYSKARRGSSSWPPSLFSQHLASYVSCAFSGRGSSSCTPHPSLFSQHLASCVSCAFSGSPAPLFLLPLLSAAHLLCHPKSWMAIAISTLCLLTPQLVTLGPSMTPAMEGAFTSGTRVSPVSWHNFLEPALPSTRGSSRIRNRCVTL